MKERKTKRILFVLLSTFGVLLSSCSNVDVRPEIKEFINNFSYENCKEKYLKAEFTYEKVIYHSGTLAGEKEVIYNFNMEEKGQFESVLEMTSTGEFITPDYPSYKKIHTYPNKGEGLEYIRETTIDNNEPIIEFLSENTFLVDLNNFYGHKENGKYTDGMYYADIIDESLRFQDLMRISDDEQYLIYETGNIIDNMEDGNVTNLTYIVNADGMLVHREEFGFNKPFENPETRFETSIDITY